ELEKKYGPEVGGRARHLLRLDRAVRRANAAIAKLPDKPEGFFKKSATQPSVEPAKVEPPNVEVVKPKIVGWREGSDGGWEYRFDGEGIWRRHFGLPPKDVAALALPKPKLEEPEPEDDEPKPAAAEPAKDEVSVKLPAVVPEAAAPEWNDAV